MTKLSEEEILHLAYLSRLRLSKEEATRFAEQLPKIVKFVEELQGLSGQLNDLNLDPVEMTDLREDKVSSSTLSHSQLQKLAPKWQDNQVEVPAVFDNDESSS